MNLPHRLGGKLKYPFLFVSGRRYPNDADATISEEEYTDMSGLLFDDDDYVSYSSEEEYVPSPPRVRRKRKKNKRPIIRF